MRLPAPYLDRPFGGTFDGVENQRHAYVFAFFERMRQRQEAAGRHAVTGVHVGAAQRPGELPVQHACQHGDQRADHEDGAQPRGAVVKPVKQLAHAYFFAVLDFS